MRGLCNIFQGKAQEGIKSEWIPFKISEAFSNSLAFPVQSPLIPYPPRFFIFQFSTFHHREKRKGDNKKDRTTLGGKNSVLYKGAGNRKRLGYVGGVCGGGKGWLEGRG